MKKYEKSDKYLVSMCVSLFLFIACGIAALCLKDNAVAIGVLPLWAFFCIFCAAAFVTYAATAVVIAVKKSLRDYLELSAEIVVVATALIALSPLALVLGLAEYLWEKAAEKRRLKEADASR